MGNGKGIEKQIQQFVYDSLEKTLKENPKKWYLVLFTILGSGCDNCETFYKEFKKIRSFTLEEEYGNNLVLGRYEFMRNIILEPAVDNIPDLILYRPADEDGKREAVRFEKHTDYDNVMTWLNDQLNRSSSEQELWLAVCRKVEGLKSLDLDGYLDNEVFIYNIDRLFERILNQ